MALVKPRTHNLAHDGQDRNQYEPQPGSQGSASWLSQETRVSQPQELLQPIAYSPFPHQVVQNHYQVLPTNTETFLKPKSDPESIPPPKPPKLPQGYADNLQPNGDTVTHSALHSAQPNTHRHEPFINEDQHQHQHQPEEILEQPKPISPPTTIHTTETTPSHKTYNSDSIYNSPQPQSHSIDSPAKNEDGRSHATRSGQEPLVSPVIGSDHHKENAGTDDIRCMLPLINENSDSTKALASQPETSGLSQHQGRASDISSSFPSAEASRPLFSSVGGILNSQPVLQRTSTPTQQYGFDEFNNNKNKPPHDALFKWQPSKSSNETQKNENRPSSAHTVQVVNDVDHQKTQNSSTTGIHQTDEISRRNLIGSRSPIKTYNASALSFGGPSDWEHFGDYQAEEVDDTDLYSHSKSQTETKMTNNSAELPTGTTPIADLQQEYRFQPKDVESAPISGFSSPPPSRLPPDIPIQDTAEISQNEAVKPDRSSLQEPSITIPDSGTESYERNIIPQHLQAIDVEDALRIWSKDGTLSKVEPAPSPYTKPASPVSSQSTKIETMLIQDFASIPNGSAHQQQSTDVKPETNPRVKLGNTTIFSMPNPNLFEPQSTRRRSQPNDNTSSIENAEFSQNSIISTQRRLNMGVAPEISATIGSNNRNSPLSSKDNVSDSASIESKLESNNITKAEKVEIPPRSNESGHQRRSTEDSPSINRGSGLNSLNISSELSIGNTQSQNTAQVSNPKKSIHQPDPTEDNGPKPSIKTASSGAMTSDAGENLNSKNSVLQQEHFEDIPILNPGVGLGSITVSSESESYAFKAQSRADKPNPGDDFPAVKTSLSASNSEHQEETERPEISSSVTANDTSTETSQKLVGPQVGSTALLKATETDNPYADLDAWGKASLNRYVAMLKEEAKADTEKEKLNVFMIFAKRESKLRAVLYGADDATTTIEQGLERRPSLHLAKTLTKRSQKALPALPPVGESQHSPSLGASGDLLGSQVIPRISTSKSATSQEESKSEQRTTVGSSLITEQPTDEMQYSPGGRPIMARGQRNEIDLKKPPVELTLREKVSKVFTQVAGFTNSTPSPSSEAPMVVNSEAKTGTQKPPYVAFKYEGSSEPTEYVSKRKSAFRPYAASTMEPSQTGSATAQEPDGKTDGILDTFSTLTLNQQSQNSIVKSTDENHSTVKSAEKHQTDDPLDLRRFVRADFDPLFSVLPPSGSIPQDSVQLQELENAMNAVPDDFGFIHQSVVAWDTEAKKEREIHESERHVRQGESELKINALFDENEIGYGDISELESEFKNSEAARKTDEDRAEYQTFLSSVFNVVWTRLHYEIAQLSPLYEEYTKVVNDTLVGKDMFEASANQFILAPTMGLLLALHQKLEVRYQKAFEAVLERDRRLKKTEISPWYTLGNVVKVKQLEKQFESAERNAIVQHCKQRNTRANKLMDVLDHNTLRGVGANQDYMQAVMKSIRRIASGRAYASMPSSEVGLGVEEVMKAKSITTILASSSEQIVQTFHVADMLLNAADYEVSVANAKLAGADAKDFARLKDERSKEDQKLMGSLEHRLALIRKDLRRTHDEIVKLLLFLGVQNGHAESSQTIMSSASADLGHEDRIQKALEGAKRRNAVKEPGG